MWHVETVRSKASLSTGVDLFTHFNVCDSSAWRIGTKTGKRPKYIKKSTEFVRVGYVDSHELFVCVDDLSSLPWHDVYVLNVLVYLLSRHRFVLVAIELGFSFAMGVSCLVFSLNLVRKLKEEVDSTARSSNRFRARLRRRETRAGGGIDSSDGSDNDGGRRGLGGSFGPWRPGGRHRSRRSANAAEERGIGSLLGRNVSSRAELYRDCDYDSGNDVSDDSEYLETVDMTPVTGPVPASAAEAPPTKTTGVCVYLFAFDSIVHIRAIRPCRPINMVVILCYSHWFFETGINGT